MADRKMVVPVLVAMMLLTGVSNTMLTKYQDQQCVANCDDIDSSKHRRLEQPIWQTTQMFVGELLCWIVIGINALYSHYSKSNSYQTIPSSEEAATDSTSLVPKPQNELKGCRVLLLSLPAICDICGTTLMNAGLLLVAASIYQMTRGALVIFVGLFSVVFLCHKLHLFQWLSLVGVVIGVAIVGLAGVIQPHIPDEIGMVLSDSSPQEPSVALVVIGVLLIAGAQIFTATQFVVEEWVLSNSVVDPITVVGYEGLFGFIITVSGMVVMHLLYGSTEEGRGGIFDMVEGWKQMTYSREMILSSFAIMISIGGFNFFGLSVTRTVSATSRSTIDTCRTLFIWVASMALGWETFKWLQVVGFVFLVYSTFLFNGIVEPPFKFLRVKEPVLNALPEEQIERI